MAILLGKWVDTDIYMGDLRSMCHILGMKYFINWQMFFQNLIYEITTQHWNVKITRIFWPQDAKNTEMNARLLQSLLCMNEHMFQEQTMGKTI